MLKLQVAQINPTVGDLRGNLRLMVDAAHSASRAGAQLVVFPELSLTGCQPGDLLEDPAFMPRVEAAFDALRAASREQPDLHWVVGLPVRRGGAGKPLYNALRVVRAGEVLLEYAKQLLATRDGVDERRHFEPGPDVARVLQVGAARVGFLICEDGWNERGSQSPLARLRVAEPDLVVAINASPSHLFKREQRHANFSAAAARHGLPILYVNQVGGQDELVFDGASFAVEADGRVAWEGARFETACTTLDLQHGRFRVDGAAPPPVSALGLGVLEFCRRQVVLGLADYARHCGFRQAVVGCRPGGLDAALTLALAVEALGAGNVIAIDDTVAGHAPERFGRLLLCTANKSALALEDGTPQGDAQSGLAPLGDLYATEVRALASYLNVVSDRAAIPAALFDAMPGAMESDGLPPPEVLDAVLKLHLEGRGLAPEEREDAQRTLRALAASPEGAALIARIHGRVARGEHQRRQAVAVIRVRAGAAGAGGPLPIAALHT